MSMSLFMVLRCAEAFLAYTLVTILLPSIAFGKKFARLDLNQRFMAYFTIGNFFVMNLVYALQLLKISNRFTMSALTILAVLCARERISDIRIKETLLGWWRSFDCLLTGKLGMKTVVYRIGRVIRIGISAATAKIGKLLKGRKIDLILLICYLVFFLSIFGRDITLNFGYRASDMPVHNYWINYLGKNQIFVAGIYPFGFHCMIYYIHELFNIDTYVLLRVFCITQNFFVNMMLLSFLKYCCKTKYAPYIGIFFYSVAEILSSNTYMRFVSTLPQEFGMLFIYPSIYFAFAYFKERRKRNPSFWYLVGFAMSFSMTFGVHFYGTMIAGLYCVGVAAGYFFRFIRPSYFWKIIATGIISILIAVLPMAVAFCQGTPLQGSLGWGMNILMGKNSNQESGEIKEERKEETSESSDQESDIKNGRTDTVEGGADVPADQNGPTDVQRKESEHTFVNSIHERMKSLFSDTVQKTRIYVLAGLKNEVVEGYYFLVVFLIAAGILMSMFRQPDYGSMLISTSVFMILMTALLMASRLGLPTLMDPSRCSMYFAYGVPLVLSFSVDVIIYILLGWLKWRWIIWIRHIASLAAVFIFVAFCMDRGMIRGSKDGAALQTNEAVTCLTNVIYEEEDFKWTIVSANDELRMGEDHGYHYETIDFLRLMEGKGGKSMVTIPTESVYIFIEKIPIDYSVHYEGSGQPVSQKMADNLLPYRSGIGIYQGEARCIVMSRMYYWAKEFAKLYPNEMKVYLETDNFICYKIKQNTYHLYNFSIDYGFNMKKYESKEEQEGKEKW